MTTSQNDLIKRFEVLAAEQDRAVAEALTVTKASYVIAVTDFAAMRGAIMRLAWTFESFFPSFLDFVTWQAKACAAPLTKALVESLQPKPSAP